MAMIEAHFKGTRSTKEVTFFLKRLENSSATRTPSGRLRLSCLDESDQELVTELSVDDLAWDLEELQWRLGSPWQGIHCRVYLDFDKPGVLDLFGENRDTVTFVFSVDAGYWAGPFSIVELGAQVRRFLNDGACPSVELSTELPLAWDGAFTLTCPIRDRKARAREVVSGWFTILEPILTEAQAILAAEVERNALVTLFDFPVSIRTACEQYLLYFAQFLRDLGIEAEADIQHRAGRVLFAVKPQDGAEALGRIQEALAEYLDLPGAPDIDSAATGNDDVAVLQLQANVHHLRGQLALASAVIQAKRAETEALELSNFQYRQMLAVATQVNRVPDLLDAARSGSSAEKPSDVEAEEAILGGLATIVSYEAPGVKVNLPELYRRLKRRFKRE